MSVLRLTTSVYDAIRAHGEQAYPLESCGALIGRATPEGWEVVRAIRAENDCTDAPHNRYRISPPELAKIERQARVTGFEIAGFYHSHPDHPAQWSQTDIEEAHWLGCTYLITSVDRGKAAETNSFLLAGTSEEDKRFENEAIQVESAPS